MNLRCRLGLHHPGWTPPQHGHDNWLHVRTCTRCGQPLIIWPKTTPR